MFPLMNTETYRCFPFDCAPEADSEITTLLLGKRGRPPVEESNVTDTGRIVLKSKAPLCLHFLQFIQRLKATIGDSLGPRVARGARRAATPVSRAAETPGGCH